MSKVLNGTRIFAACLLGLATHLGCTQVDNAPASAISTPPASQPGSTLREFTFTVQDGKTITGTTQATPPPSGKRMVLFTPFLDRTDGNLYNASLNSLWNLYGKERGLFQLADARTLPEATLGGNAICWRVSNPAADFCVFPTKDETSGAIAALTVWMQ